MFWGLVLETSKKYTQKVDQTFHISQAAIDLECSGNSPIQLIVEYENSSFVLATLSKADKIYQVPLDLIFKTGDQVSFRTIGVGKVHLSGYHVLEDVDSLLMNGEEESDLEEMEEIEEVKGKRKKTTPKGKDSKKPKFDGTNEDESDEDDEFDEEDEDESDEEIKAAGKKAKGGKGMSWNNIDDEEDEDEDDEDDDDEEDDEDDEDDELDEEIEDEEDMDFDESDEDEDDEEQMKTPKSAGKKIPQTPNGVASGMKGKDKSGQKQKKDKSILGTPGKDGKTPKSEAKAKGEKPKNSSAESTPQKKGSESSKKGEKTPKSPKSEGSPQKKVLEGGVISEEIRVGNGPMAKPGKMANVYYVGTLASTKKQFDSVQNGPGFKFRIGRNEVIKGWDIGLNGMKVGGKRKLTIPPHLAYGAKGSPPVIPPNSTLVFTVELKGIS